MTDNIFSINWKCSQIVHEFWYKKKRWKKKIFFFKVLVVVTIYFVSMCSIQNIFLLLWKKYLFLFHFFIYTFDVVIFF